MLVAARLISHRLALASSVAGWRGRPFLVSHRSCSLHPRAHRGVARELVGGHAVDRTLRTGRRGGHRDSATSHASVFRHAGYECFGHRARGPCCRRKPRRRAHRLGCVAGAASGELLERDQDAARAQSSRLRELGRPPPGPPHGSGVARRARLSGGQRTLEVGRRAELGRRGRIDLMVRGRRGLIHLGLGNTVPDRSSSRASPERLRCSRGCTAEVGRTVEALDAVVGLEARVWPRLRRSRRHGRCTHRYLADGQC
mmetsp:Transcript_115237/g.366312  ORF Transcript_115237/g.366312 Transcript_115237/m.366312 type:complete len:256 (+) Transcript_115237:1684-2451(+)